MQESVRRDYHVVSHVVLCFLVTSLNVGMHGLYTTFFCDVQKRGVREFKGGTPLLEYEDCRLFLWTDKDRGCEGCA